MAKILSGYIGLFRHPHTRDYETTIYAISDENKRELILIPLQPGFYADIVDFGFSIGYQRILLVPTSVELPFASDIFNYVKWFSPKKESVGVIYPETFSAVPHSPAFSARYHVQDLYSSFWLPKVSVEFIPGLPDDCSCAFSQDKCVCYNILVKDGKKAIYLATYLTDEMLMEIGPDPYINEIHVPYNTSLYGGLNYDKIYQNSKYRKFFKKIFPNVFNCGEELRYFRDNFPNHVPEYMRTVFI